MIELTPEQRQAVERGEPVRVSDPSTQGIYVVVRAEVFDRLAGGKPPAEESLPEVPPGIRRSQEALRRDLPSLLNNKRTYHQWAAYHGDERIGIASTAAALERECRRRGLRDDEFYVGWIDYCELVEEEEIDPPDPGQCEW